MNSSIKNVFRLIRPHQYIKNLFIFLPLFFVGRITDAALFINALKAFVAFSISSSAVYILNDYRDIEEDRQHPKKKHRPLASGSISKKSAVLLMAVFFLAGISLMTAISFKALVVLGVYVGLNFGYSFFLKHVAILDVSIIAVGFVLRLIVGSTVTGVPLSMWIVIMTFLLAMFIALAKRRDDVLIFLNTGEKMRKVTDGYNLRLIEAAMTIMASVVIVAYILYTTSAMVMARLHDEYLYLTSFFVIIGIMRYLQITFVENNSSSPTEIILRDRFMQLTIIGWVLVFVWIIYA